MKREFRQARIAKDKNFDGKFFFRVKTTGIFCRPSCPSPTAKEENVVYFNDMFEAIDRHYRPCLRCRPDINIDYYNSNVSGILTVQTALKMIYDGYLNHHSVTELAKELSLSDRHLRKLFIDSLRVPPVKIAKCHRALFAKKLLMFSDQSVTDIGFASGFGSLRQFNLVFTKIFGTPPSAVKKETAGGYTEAGHTTLLLAYKKPLDFAQMISFLKRREVRGVEMVRDTSYAPTFRTKQSKGYFSLTDNPKKSGLELNINCDDIQCYMEIYNRVRRMVDLNTDFSRINEKFKKDNHLSKGMVDSFPATDLGIIRALEKNGRRPTKKEILKIAEKWQPSASGTNKGESIMYYTKFNTRFCEVILAGDEQGLSHLHLNTGEGSRQFEIPRDWESNPKFFADARTQVLEYVEGRRKKFDLTLNPGGTGFQKKVWEQLRQIPYGRVVSYGDIAQAIGNKKAARAVGAANGRNPIPLIIPCHRVVGATGNLTGFAHGVAIKEKLIDLERNAAGKL